MHALTPQRMFTTPNTLKTLRQDAGLGVDTLAERAGVPLATVLAIEAGTLPLPAAADLVRLGRVLGVEGWQLLVPPGYSRKRARRAYRRFRPRATCELSHALYAEGPNVHIGPHTLKRALDDWAPPAVSRRGLPPVRWVVLWALEDLRETFRCLRLNGVPYRERVDAVLKNGGVESTALFVGGLEVTARLRPVDALGREAARLLAELVAESMPWPSRA